MNSRYLNNWIIDGNVLDPFRVLYPERTEFSYTSFRRADNIGKNRLDFYFVSRNILGDIRNIMYEDRLGRDFDPQVKMVLGKGKGVHKEDIYKETINSSETEYVGILTFLDIVNEHKVQPCENVRQILGDLENRIRDLELYKIRNEYGDRDEEGILVITGIENRERVINGIINGLPDTEALLAGDLSCSRRDLYEVMIIGLKNRLLAIQVKMAKGEKNKRKQLCELREMYEIL